MKWITNCYPGCAHHPNIETVTGPPKASRWMSSEEIAGFGLVGIYEKVGDGALVQANEPRGADSADSDGAGKETDPVSQPVDD